MIFPIRTDRKQQYTPWVNYGLIAANVLVYLIVGASHGGPAALTGPLVPTHPQLHQFITYQFLHAGPWHLLGNMLFLYVFGNSVEDRLGHVGYLAFYLAGGVLAGLGHALTDSAPVVGASGAVSAVTGMYLVLFPVSNVTLVYWFYFVGSFEVSSVVLILFQIGQNIIMHLFGGGGVAYMAHLSGYAWGLAIGLALLLSRLLPREPYDLLALIEHRRRRVGFRRMARGGFRPWERAGADEQVPRQVAPGRTRPAEQRVIELRARITRALGEQNIGAAAESYVALLRLDPGQVMSQQDQLDLANQLMSEGRYGIAARAYELFLSAFGQYTQREQVQLILGLIYVRYLDGAERGRQLLRAALPRLTDENQRRLAEEMMEGD